MDKNTLVNKKNAVVATLTGLCASLVSSPAFAGLDTSTLTVDDAPFYALAGIAIVAVIGVWMTKKGFSIFGGSR